MSVHIDIINKWSEIKIEIVEKYARAYSRILSTQKTARFYHVYIDAFSGAGKHFSKTSGGLVEGSPLKALSVTPPFKFYHFIDLDRDKVDLLKSEVGARKDVKVYSDDCNDLLPNVIFPNIKDGEFKRALCLLDPYGLHLDWKVIAKAGEMNTIEIFLNFPLHDMDRNVLWQEPDKASQNQRERMDRFWGGTSWREEIYDAHRDLFRDEKRTELEIVKIFQKRLKGVAGFKFVPDPLPMRNNNGRTLYYLFFAAQKPVAADIVSDIFKKYK
ncbi:MAG: three-Cys-motif partner protein TcmP [candidate division Zixibacteria bacterium]|nr:three-Cys-motif partner protein TcmP [candidate division Zixibacteria bacterium]